MVSFKTAPTERVITVVNGIGGSVSGFGNKANQTYLIERSELNTMQTILGATTWNLDTKQTAPKGYINAANIDLFITVLRRLHAVVYAIHRFANTSSAQLQISSTRYTTTPNNVTAKKILSDTAKAFDGAAPIDSTLMDETIQSTKITRDADQPNILSITGTPQSTTQVWTSSLADPPSRYARGIFARYEKDYSSPDRAIFTQFFSTFPDFFMPNEFALLGSFWEDEMAETEVGGELAHMMLACMIAFKGDKGIVPMYGAGGLYHGCVLTGGGKIVTPAGDVVAKTIDEVNAEIGEIKTHETVLTSIKAIFNVTADNREITSMRKLRELCGVREDMLPSTADMEGAKALLPYLNFAGSYLAINTSSFQQVLPLMANPATPIPSTLPMHPGYFFTTSRMESILSAFGSTCPTLQTATGTSEYRLTNIVPAAGQIRAPAAYSPVAPIILQTLRVDVSAAAAYWTHIFTTGTAAMNTSTSAGQGARKYTGTEKQDMWRLLNEWVGVGVTARGNAPAVAAPEVGATDGGRRRQRDDDDDVGDDDRYRARQRGGLL